MSFNYAHLRGTTNPSGAATVDSVPILGAIEAVFVDGAALTDGADLTLQPVHTKAAGGAELGELIVNHGDVGNSTIDKLYPRRAATDNAGANYAPATSTTAPTRYIVPGCRLRATIANGGNAKAFALWIVWEE